MRFFLQNYYDLRAFKTIPCYPQLKDTALQ